MKLIKTFGYVALVAILAMAFGGASAMAEGNTALCKADESPCAAGNLITHYHAVTQAGKKTTLLTSAITVECDGLFLSDAQSSLANPLIFNGVVTYSNCNNKCTVTEENGPAEVSILKSGHESANFIFKLLLHVICGSFNCRYSGEGLKGHLSGPLLSVVENGEFTVEKQTVTRESGGFLCPLKGEIDVVGTSLDRAFISD